MVLFDKATDIRLSPIHSLDKTSRESKDCHRTMRQGIHQIKIYETSTKEGIKILKGFEGKWESLSKQIMEQQTIRIKF